MNKATILIADDDTQMLKMLKRHLEHAGYGVNCVRDAYQALQTARRDRPDLLILDVNMPAGDGFSVQQRLQKMSELAGIPVIYVTGERSVRVNTASHSQGTIGVIYKPFEVEHVIETVQLALSNAGPRALESGRPAKHMSRSGI